MPAANFIKPLTALAQNPKVREAAIDIGATVARHAAEHLLTGRSNGLPPAKASGGPQTSNFMAPRSGRPLSSVAKGQGHDPMTGQALLQAGRFGQSRIGAPNPDALPYLHSDGSWVSANAPQNPSQARYASYGPGPYRRNVATPEQAAVHTAPRGGQAPIGSQVLPKKPLGSAEPMSLSPEEAAHATQFGGGAQVPPKVPPKLPLELSSELSPEEAAHALRPGGAAQVPPNVPPKIKSEPSERQSMTGVAAESARPMTTEQRPTNPAPGARPGKSTLGTPVNPSAAVGSNAVAHDPEVPASRISKTLTAFTKSIQKQISAVWEEAYSGRRRGANEGSGNASGSGSKTPGPWNG